MDPIATYTERLLEVRRDFALHRDRVVVQARWLFKGRFENVIQLNTLQKQAREFTVRYRMARYAGWVLAVAAMFFAAIYYYAHGGPIGVFGYIALGATILGGLFVAITYPNRRIRFARFETTSGRPGLDIGRAGNNAETFKAFVAAVAKQIGKAK